MNEFLNKISLYDQLGYIAVGGLGYGLLLYDLNYINISHIIYASNSFIIAIVVYFIGHTAQAIANQFFKENKTEYSENKKKILLSIKSHFQIPEFSDGEAFGVCYLWAIGNDKTGHISIFNANYGLYRGWTIVLFIQSLVFSLLLVLEAIHCLFNVENLIGLLVCSILSILTFKRSKRFYKYIGEKVFQTFIIYKNIQ